MGAPFAHVLRPRYAECDLQGVVFNAHYLAYFDISLTELWRAACGGYRAMIDQGLDMVVAETQLRFLAPARFDEEITLEVAITHLGTTSILTEHRIRREAERLVQGTMRHVLVDLKTLNKTPIPDWVRAGLAPWVVADG